MPQPQPTPVHLDTLILPLFVLKLIFCSINPLIAWLLSVTMYLFPLLKKKKNKKGTTGDEWTPKGHPSTTLGAGVSGALPMPFFSPPFST